jgi:hypothetical protein
MDKITIGLIKNLFQTNVEELAFENSKLAPLGNNDDNDPLKKIFSSDNSELVKRRGAYLAYLFNGLSEILKYSRSSVHTYSVERLTKIINKYSDLLQQYIMHTVITRQNETVMENKMMELVYETIDSIDQIGGKRGGRTRRKNRRNRRKTRSNGKRTSSYRRRK